MVNFEWGAALLPLLSTTVTHSYRAYSTHIEEESYLRMWSPLRWCDKMDPESASNCYFMHPFCGHSVHRHCSLRYLPCAVILSPISPRSPPAAVITCVCLHVFLHSAAVTFGCPRFAFEFRSSIRDDLVGWNVRDVFFFCRIANIYGLPICYISFFMMDLISTA